MVSRKKRHEVKGQHAPTKRRCPSRFHLRIVRNRLRQAGGSSGCFHGFPSSIDGAQPGDRHVFADEREYVDGAVVRLTLDEQGSSHYDWKDGGFEMRPLIGHTMHGMWFQKENDRDGRFTVEFSADFSEEKRPWWCSRIGTDYAPTQRGGTFHLGKKTTLYEPQRYSAGTVRIFSRHSR